MSTTIRTYATLIIALGAIETFATACPHPDLVAPKLAEGKVLSEEAWKMALANECTPDEAKAIDERLAALGGKAT